MHLFIVGDVLVLIGFCRNDLLDIELLRVVLVSGRIAFKLEDDLPLRIVRSSYRLPGYLDRLSAISILVDPKDELSALQFSEIAVHLLVLLGQLDRPRIIFGSLIGGNFTYGHFAIQADTATMCPTGVVDDHHTIA